MDAIKPKQAQKKKKKKKKSILIIVYTQWSDSKYCNLTLIILFIITHSFVHS